MFPKHRPEAGLGLSCTAKPELEARHPEPRLDVLGIGLDDVREELDGFEVAPGTAQILGTCPIRRWCLHTGQQHDCGGE
jgi:hypothetical protein